MRPTWQLPPGVPRGLWDYVESRSIARDYDDFFAYNSLFEFDLEILRTHCQPADWVVDLGCGTGRALLPLVQQGCRGLAIDLSRHMLEVVREKAAAESLSVDLMQANLVELECLADNSFNCAICMFSTLGMIRGRKNRRTMLAHVRRLVRPGGRFVLHVHNYWFNLRDPGGPWWLLKNLCTAPWRSEIEVGDKWFPYRGLPSMYLHVFRWRELAADLTLAGWKIRQRIALDPQRRRALRAPWFLSGLRANGWIVVCQRVVNADDCNEAEESERRSVDGVESPGLA